MKSIALLLSLTLIACSTPTVEIQRPSGVSESIRWGTYEHYAFNQGRMHFNKDSSLILIVPERARYNEQSTSLIGANLTINEE